MSTNTNTSYDEVDMMDCDIVSQHQEEIEVQKAPPRFHLILRLPSKIIVMKVLAFYGTQVIVMKLLRQLS